MQKLFRSLSVVVLTMMIAMPVFVMALPVQAELDEDDLWGDQKDGIYTAMGEPGEADPRVIAAGVIKVLMGFLGIIAVVIILIGGFKWMTAGGGDDKITEAKKLITAGVIGLIIIIAAFGIATFVINNLLTITGGN